MNLRELIKNWKLVTPAAAAVASAVLWYVGVDSIRPVMAAEYTKDMQSLNAKQLEFRREYLSDRLAREQERLFNIRLKIMDLEQQRQPIPPELRQMEFMLQQRVDSITKDEFTIHQQQIKMLGPQ